LLLPRGQQLTHERQVFRSVDSGRNRFAAAFGMNADALRHCAQLLEFFGKTGRSEYIQLSGTSMAAPAVTGAAALLLQKEPTLTPDSVKYRLMKSASRDFPNLMTSTDPITGITYKSRPSASPES
jgi:subtilisin family serine protease